MSTRSHIHKKYGTLRKKYYFPQEDMLKFAYKAIF
jgi:hypothetical protein